MFNKYIVEIKRLILLFRKLLTARIGAQGQVYIDARLSGYKELWRSVAKDIGAHFSELEKDIWQIEMNGQKTRIFNDRIELDNPVTLEIAGRKPLVNRLLRQNGIPVADQVVFPLTDLEKGYMFLEKHPLGCVVKPARGSAGKGVTTHILHRREVKKAALLASLYSSEIVMEPLIAGESFRILVLEGVVIDVVKREGLRIKGDGVLSVQELVETAGDISGSTRMLALERDRDCLFNLQRQGLTLDSIIPKGADILLKAANTQDEKRIEIRTVYNKKVTEPICDSIREMSECAAKVLGSRFLGVDVISTDISIPLQTTGGVFNEVNTTPSLHHHYDLETDKYPLIALDVVSTLLGVGRSALH